MEPSFSDDTFFFFLHTHIFLTCSFILSKFLYLLLVKKKENELKRLSQYASSLQFLTVCYSRLYIFLCILYGATRTRDRRECREIISYIFHSCDSVSAIVNVMMSKGIFHTYTRGDWLGRVGRVFFYYYFFISSSRAIICTVLLSMDCNWN